MRARCNSAAGGSRQVMLGGSSRSLPNGEETSCRPVAVQENRSQPCNVRRASQLLCKACFHRLVIRFISIRIPTDRASNPLAAARTSTAVDERLPGDNRQLLQRQGRKMRVELNHSAMLSKLACEATYSCALASFHLSPRSSSRTSCSERKHCNRRAPARACLSYLPTQFLFSLSKIQRSSQKSDVNNGEMREN